MLPLVVAIGIATLLTSCAPPQQEAARSESAAIAWPSGVQSLDFAAARDIWTRTLHELISEPLVYYGADSELVPAAASSWSVSEDGLSIRFELRQDLLWHDGSPVTSEDVVHTWRAITDPESGAPDRAANFSLVEGVEAEGRHAVIVRYAAPQPSAFDAWALAPLIPAHRAPENADLPVGCGPWILEDWSPGQRITLRGNTDHPYAAPALERLDIEIIREPATSFAALRSGEVDVAPLYPETWQKVRDDDAFEAAFSIDHYALLYYFYIAWHAEGDGLLFEDPRVRRALTHAIDRQVYLDSVGGPADRVGVTSFHPDNWAFDPAVSAWPHDPDEARRLLGEAGWSDTDGDGVRDREGLPFSFFLHYPSGNVQTEQIALFVQSELAEVGVLVELAATEWPVLQDLLGRRDFDAAMLGLRLDPDPDLYNVWHSSQADEGLNYAALRDPEVDALIESGRSTFDVERRAEIYAQLQRRLHDLEPITILFYPSSRVAASRELLGLEAGPRGHLRWRPGPSLWHRRGEGNSPP